MAHISAYKFIFTFGKHKNTSLGMALDIDPTYIRWIATNEAMPKIWREACQGAIENVDISHLKLPVRVVPKITDFQKVELTFKNKTTIIVSFPRDMGLLEQFKYEIDGRKWDAKNQEWTFPSTQILKAVELFGGTKNIDADDKVKAIYKEELSRKKDLAEISVKEDTELELSKFYMTPFNYQKVAIEFIDRAHGRAMVADSMGLGKMQALHSKIVTPTGWTTMGELNVGDLIIGSEGTSIKITDIFEHKNVELFKVTFSDGSSTICGDDHLWSVQNASARYFNTSFKVKTLKEIRSTISYANGNRRHFIPMTLPVVYDNISKLPIDPYTLGLLLGDGCISNRSVCLTTTDSEIIEEFSKNIDSSETIRQSIDKNGIDYFIRGVVTRNKLKELNLMGTKSDTKFIPSIYKFSSIESRIAILQGLMDTDGWIDKEKRNSNHIGYCTTSEQLKNDIVEIVQSLGGTVKSNIKKPFYYDKDRNRVLGKLAWTLTLALPDSIIPFRLSRKKLLYKPRCKYPPQRAFIKVESIGIHDARCIEVDAPNHLYLTDNFIVTHNTVTAIAYAHMKQHKTLIICPKSVAIGWYREIERATKKKATMWDSTGKVGRVDSQYHIINYEAVQKRAKELRALNCDLLVCDEATYLKSRKTIRTKAIVGDGKQKRLYPGIKTKELILLTGTPILNKPEEAYALLNFVDPLRFNNFWHFTQKYGGWRGEPTRNLDDLHLRTKDVVIRRLKKDVLKELPTKQRHNLYVEMSDVEIKEYHKLLKSLFNKWNVLGKPTVAEMPKIQKYLISKKIPRLKEMIQELLDQDRGVLVYSCYVDPLKELAEFYGDNAGLIHGQLSTQERQQAIDNLKAGKAKVGLFSIGAGAMGIDGLQYSIDTVVFLDRYWIPSIHEQAEDRILRIGQTKQVSAYYMTCVNTIDEHMKELLYEKQDIIDRIVDGKSITPEASTSFFKEFVRMMKKDYSDEMKKLSENNIIDVEELEV